MSRGGSKKGTLTDEQQRQLDIQEHEDEIFYSPRYEDDNYEYRHVILPKQIAKWLPGKRLLTEQEWRGLGVKQSLGWQHHMLHDPEPHILIFRRDKPAPAAPAPARSSGAQAV